MEYIVLGEPKRKGSIKICKRMAGALDQGRKFWSSDLFVTVSVYEANSFSNENRDGMKLIKQYTKAEEVKH